MLAEIKTKTESYTDYYNDYKELHIILRDVATCYGNACVYTLGKRYRVVKITNYTTLKLKSK